MSLSKELYLSKGMVDDHLDLLAKSAASALENIRSITNTRTPINALQLMKFNQIGYDPLDVSMKLNLIEQLNQTFTHSLT